MDFTAILTTIGRWFLSSGIKIILVVIVSLLAVRFVSVISERLTQSVQKRRKDPEFKKRTDTLRSVLRYAVTITILIIALIIILSEIGIEIGPILAAAGVLGLAVGFGAQSLVKDVISGFFILLEDQIRVGDVVRIADCSGVVEHVNLKMTVLRDLAGNVHYIPNGEISVVMNMTKGYSRYVLNIGVAYREDVDEVMDIMREVDEELRKDPDYEKDILEPIEILGLDEFADSALIIKARIKTRPIKQWRVGREFNRRLKIQFDRRNIEIPFPHRTVYIGEDKKGQSPPLNVNVERSNDPTE